MHRAEEGSEGEFTAVEQRMQALNWMISDLKLQQSLKGTQKSQSQTFTRLLLMVKMVKIIFCCRGEDCLRLQPHNTRKKADGSA